MKNYLFKSLFKVKDPDWKVLDRSHETNMFENYVKMQEYSIATFKHMLVGEWELVSVTGEVDNINQAFYETFWAIHRIWHKEPCNILYADPDTIALKPIDCLDQFDKFMMFNYTDPKSFTTDNSYGKKFDNWFNAGVRYFPSTMSEEVWDVGSEMSKSWDYNSYDTEQIILNTMLWMQDIDLQTALRPDIAYQGHWFPLASAEEHDQWNGVSIDQAKIIHLHGSRNSEVKLQLMENIYKKMTRTE